jgi:hypothetical protein
MSDAGASDERLTRQVEHWLLALLRFAVTRDETDRAALRAAADELDRGQSRFEKRAFTFFARTSEEVCAAILAPADPCARAVLRRLLSRIDDPRLGRALEAALDPELHRRKRSARPKRDNLWRGLKPAKCDR